MTEASKRIWAWQDTLGTWHTHFSEDPEDFHLHNPPDETFYVRADIADGMLAALKGCLEALREKLHHDAWETINDYPYTAIPVADAAIAKAEEMNDE